MGVLHRGRPNYVSPEAVTWPRLVCFVVGQLSEGGACWLVVDSQWAGFFLAWVVFLRQSMALVTPVIIFFSRGFIFNFLFPL